VVFTAIQFSDGIFIKNSSVAFEDVTLAHGSYGMFGSGSVISLLRTRVSDMKDGALSFSASNVSLEDSSVEDVHHSDGIGLYSRSALSVKNSSVRDLAFGTAIALYDASVAEIQQGFVSEAEICIELYGASFMTLTDTTVENCEDYGIEFYRSEVIGSGNTIRGNGIGIYASGKIVLTDSIIADNVRYGVYESSENVDVRGNWWGDASGPYHAAQNPTGLGDEVYGNALFDPWLLEEPSDEPPVPPKPACCSNVAFLPGLQATRLDLAGNRLWEPNSPLDTPQLYLDEFGHPEISGIATDGVMDEAFGFNIYKKFIEFMNTDMVGAGIIKEWMMFPYDWRFNPEDIAESDILLQYGDTYSMADEIIRLAENSPTGKVTIITHSNGGLVAKALISTLEAQGHGGLIDQLIMVAAPQLGTPKALAGMLHGDDQTIPSKIGFILPKRVARSLAEHMPSAYTLLPSKKYFSDVFDSVIEFDPDVSEIYDFPALYVGSIDTRQELDLFLAGENVRTEPVHENTDEPNVLSANLLRKATSTQEKLDAWVAPVGVKIIQIAGWGLDTIRGIRYDDCDIPFCPDTLNHLDRELLLVHDGDGTVVIPSAVAMEGVETYYVNLLENNFLLKRNRDHADILEVEYMNGLLMELIKREEFTESVFITDTKPIPKDEDKKLRFRIHSPVSLDLYSEGNHTGLVPNTDPDSDLQHIEQQIPNSYYLEFGETKYAGVDTFATTTVVLVGQSAGTFTFEIDEVLGDELVSTTSFSGIPVIEGARVTMDVQRVASSTVLALDMDADGIVDAVIEPGEGISTEELIGILRGMVRSLDLADKQEKKLLKRIEKLEKVLEKEFKKEKKEKMKTGEAFEKLKEKIEKFVKKGYLSKEDAQELLHIIEQIKVAVVE